MNFFASGILQVTTPFNPIYNLLPKNKLQRMSHQSKPSPFFLTNCPPPRHGPCNELFCFGNPASDNSVQSYLQFVTKEQTAAHVSPKQAIPLFFDKLSTPTRYLVSKAFSSGDLTPIQRYIFACDAAFFCTDFFSSDRGSDFD